MTDKTLILVIGCHRSGTSAVAGSLAQMGIEFGDGLLGPAFDNPKGFFESRAVVALHDRLLASLGGSWDKPPNCDGRLTWDDTEDIAAIVRDLPGPVCAVKDPRASLFVDRWRDACEQEGVRLCVLEVCRDRYAVAASLMKREGWDKQRALRLFEAYERSINAARCGTTHETWARIHFPADLSDEDVWQRILTDFEVWTEIEVNAGRAFVDPRLIHHGQHSPPLWTVIIPSRDDEKVMDCITSLVDAHGEVRPDQIVIVSDGLSPHLRECYAGEGFTGMRWVEGAKPFVFARAINMGVLAAAPGSDIVILGDDVRFETPGGVDKLARASDGAAVVAPEVIGDCGQEAQREGSGVDTADWVAFICAYIPRAAWDAVGPLDERFVGYGYDDADWCIRAREHGETRVAHDVTVRHLHASSYRRGEDCAPKYKANRRLFVEKWNHVGAQLDGVTV